MVKRRELGDPAVDPSARIIATNLARLRSIMELTFPDVSMRGWDVIPPILINRVEQGKRRPLAAEIVSLAHAFDVTPSVLLWRWEGSSQVEGLDFGRAPLRGRLEPGTGENRIVQRVRSLVLCDARCLEQLAEDPTRETLRRLMRDRFTARLREVMGQWGPMIDEMQAFWGPRLGTVGNRPDLRGQMESDRDLRDRFLLDLRRAPKWSDDRRHFELDTLGAEPWMWDDSIRTLFEGELRRALPDPLSNARFLVCDFDGRGRVVGPDWVMGSDDKEPMSFVERWP